MTLMWEQMHPNAISFSKLWETIEGRNVGKVTKIYRKGRKKEMESITEKISAAIPALGKINELYTSAGSIVQQQYQRAVSRRKIGSRLGAVLGAILAYIIVSVVIGLLLNTFVGSVGSVGLFLLISVCIGMIIGITTYKMIKKLITNLITPSSISSTAQRQLDDISEQICHIYVENSLLIESLPRDYRYYDAAVYFEKVFANGQAESMKEAINLYENSLHQRKMEAQYENILAINQRQTEMLSNIEKTSRTAATFSILNYLSR